MLTPLSTVFSVISMWPVHLSTLSWTSFNQYLCTIFFLSYWLPFHITIVEKMDRVREEWILSQSLSSVLGREYWPSPGWKQRLPVLSRLISESVENKLGEAKMLVSSFSPFPFLLSDDLFDRIRETNTGLFGKFVSGQISRDQNDFYPFSETSPGFYASAAAYRSFNPLPDDKF